MASKNGYVSEKVLNEGRETIILSDPNMYRNGYIAQWLEVIGDMGLQLVTQSRQPGSDDHPHVRTAQEIYLTGSPDGKIGRWALAGEPVQLAVSMHPFDGEDPSREFNLALALVRENVALSVLLNQLVPGSFPHVELDS